MGDSEKVRLPGLESLFGLRKEDPLSFLAASDLHRSRSNTSALRSSLNSTPTPSLASSSRSDPFAFSLNSTDSASIRSWGATSSSEYDDARSSLSSQHDHDPANRSSPQPHPRRRPSKHRAARISRNLDTLSAMRGYSELLPPSAPPRSSSLQSVSAIAHSEEQEAGDARMEDDAQRRHEASMAALEQSIFFRANQHAQVPDSPATERGTLHPFVSGSDTASIRSTLSYGGRSDMSSPAHPYAPMPVRAPYTNESSPRSSISTAPTSYENLPPSSFGMRGRRSLEMAAEMPQGQFEPRHVEHPLAYVLPAVNETPVRMSPVMMQSPLPPTPVSLAPPLPANAASPALSSSGSLRYPCPHCYKRFSRPSSLRIHVFSHTGEKPYICKTCGRGFSVQSNLRRHQRIHTGPQSATPEVAGMEAEEAEGSEADEASTNEGDTTMQP